jgi:hypothetical protein
VLDSGDHEVLVMNRLTTFSPTAGAVIVAMSLAMATPTAALAACKGTLQGELVQAPGPRQAFPQKYLYFGLLEITQSNRGTAANLLQSFTVPNARTALPIPFALNIDLPKDCPSELELHVAAGDSDQPGIRLSDEPLRGIKRVRLDQHEIIPVWGPYF